MQETTTAIPMKSRSIASCRCFADGSCSCDRSPGHDGHALVLEMEERDRYSSTHIHVKARATHQPKLMRINPRFVELDC